MKGMHSIRYILVTLTVSLCYTPVFAECVNTAAPSCGVYKTCFNKYCNCEDSEVEYFLSFGQKYCNAFLEEDSFSTKGKQWKDSTLKCLQESIIPLIPIKENSLCNCKKIKEFALNSHVSCYTQSHASMCDLPLTDIILIGKTIIENQKFKSLIKEYEGVYMQIKGVLSNCVTNAKKEENVKQWQNNLRQLESKAPKPPTNTSVDIPTTPITLP